VEVYRLLTLWASARLDRADNAVTAITALVTFM
jgi:hypothetical protein